VTGLIDPRPFTSHSGVRLPFKIECDAYTDADLAAFAAVAAARIKFRHVIAAGSGAGARFAEALRRYERTDATIVLIADDVLTTGNSLEKAASMEQDCGTDHWDIRGLVLYDRSREGQRPDWVSAFFVLGEWLR
jgi:hypothetical protein